MHDRNTLQDIIDKDNDFYRQQAASFHATRTHSWPGWLQLPLTPPQRVLDVAGGNGRFYRFLTSQFAPEFTYLNLDASRQLLAASGLQPDQCLHYDLLTAYAHAGNPFYDIFGKQKFDLIVCFGFFHHVPTHSLRQRLLTDLWEQVSDGGSLYVSFWQFLPAKKNLIVKDLGDDDYWLSWGGDPQHLRFAHFTTDQEINELTTSIEADGAQKIADFGADGHTHALNRYLGWHKS